MSLMQYIVCYMFIYIFKLYGITLYIQLLYMHVQQNISKLAYNFILMKIFIAYIQDIYIYLDKIQRLEGFHFKCSSGLIVCCEIMCIVFTPPPPLHRAEFIVYIAISHLKGDQKQTKRASGFPYSPASKLQLSLDPPFQLIREPQHSPPRIQRGRRSRLPLRVTAWKAVAIRSTECYLNGLER